MIDLSNLKQSIKVVTFQKTLKTYLMDNLSDTTFYYKQKPTSRWYITGDKEMKKIKKSIVILFAMFAIGLPSLTSCGMSYDDAYNVGYGAGTLMRYMIDN